MAEMHLFGWSRVTDRKLSNPESKSYNISTYRHRTSDLADIEIIFTPNTDLVIVELYIAREIVYNHPESIDWDFVKEHIVLLQTCKYWLWYEKK